MANKFLLKRGSGAPSSIDEYELVYDYTNNVLYTKVGSTITAISGGSGGGAVDSIANFADNRVLTASDADSIRGEGNLTFDGSTLAVTGALTTTSTITASGNITTSAGHLVLPYGEINDSGTDLNIVGTNAITLQSESGTALTIPNASTNIILEGELFLKDDKDLVLGNDSDLQLKHDNSHAYIKNATGDLYIQNTADDKDIVLQSDNGSGGVENYMQIDGSAGRTLFNKPIRVNDDVEVQVGSAADLKFYHNATNSFIANGTGNLYIRNNHDGGQIIFQTDDGSGGYATYFNIKGNDGISRFLRNVRANDSIQFQVGSSNDAHFKHDGSNTYLINNTGDLIISNTANGKDVILKSDDGSGGTTAYLTLDGSASNLNFNNKALVAIGGIYGNSNTLNMYANTYYFKNTTGGVLGTLSGSTLDIPNTGDWSYIKNNTNSGGLRFGTKDGSGNYANQIEISNTGNYVKLNENTSVTGYSGATEHFQLNFSGTTNSLLKIVNSGWSNETTHDILFNYWQSNIGDYTYLKSAGNSTSGHGIALVGDTVFAVGDTTVATGAVTNSATAPFTDTWFTVNGSGNGVFKGSVTSVGASTTTLNASSTITTDYGVMFTNGNTNFLLYNNTGDNLFYLRDTTNGQMLQTWTTSQTTIHKPTIVNGNLTIASGGDLILSDSGGSTSTYLYNDGVSLIGHIGGAERFRFDNSGKMGIGTNAPAYRLHLQQAGGVMQQLKATDSAQAYMKFVNSATGDGQFTDGFLFGLDSDESVAIWNYEGTAMRFATSGAEKMRIDSSGNVGIGQSSPGYKLDVNGNGRFVADLRVEGRLLSQNGSSSAPSYSFNSQGNAGMYRIGTGVGLSAGGNTKIQVNADGRINYNGWTGVDHITVRSNGHTNSGSSSTFYIKFCTVVVDNSPSNYNGLNLSGTLYNGDNNHGNTIDWSIWFNAALDNAQIAHGGYMMSKGAHWISNILVQRTGGDGEIDNGTCTYELYYDVNNNWANNFYNVATEVHYPSEGKFNVTWNHDQSEVTTLPGTQVVNVISNTYDDSNQTLVPNGAAGSPAYSFMDSRNTGMYRHGSDELGFSTGGNTRLLIQPHKTYINSTGANGLVMNNDEGTTSNSGRIFFEGTQTSAVYQSGTALTFRSGATSGASSGTQQMYVNSSGLTVTNDLNVTGNSYFNYGLVVNEGSNDADFRVEGNGDANLIRTDAANDRVGIRTGSPACTLDVNGILRWDNSRGYHGNPRSMAIGYSGGNYGQFGYNIEFTTTSGQHTASFTDIATRVDMHDGLRVYSSVSNATGGSNISWTEYLRCQNTVFTYKGQNILHTGNGGGGSNFDADKLDGIHASQFLRSDANDTATGSLTLAAQTWNGNITWNNGKNIFVAGESSFDVSGSGVFQIWDSGTGAPFIKCDVGQQTEIGQAGSRGLKVHGNSFINGQLRGGFGAQSTSGTTDWNHSTNARSGNGHTLLLSTHTNGPGTTTVNETNNMYFHLFNFEYAGYDNDGNMTQLAFPYSTGGGPVRPVMRTRYNGTWSNYSSLVTANSNGQIQASTIGSQSAPDITFVGNGDTDTNTGIFWQSSDDFRFTAGGNQRFACNANGLQLYDKIVHTNTASRDKIRMWTSSYYAIGMDTTYTYGALNGYCMTFQMNDEDNRGWWWGHNNHSDAQGAMSLDTDGKLALAHSMRIGYGESDTTEPGATYRLDVSGSIGATADVVAYISSDKKLKDNIKNIENPLEKLEKLNGVEFDWNDKQDLYEGHDIGVIAQEVEEVLPEIVDTREDGHKAVKYDRMVALLIEVAKEQQQQINELKEKLNG